MENATKELNNWLDDELKTVQSPASLGERLPALKLEEKKITEFEVDFSKPFPKWTGADGIVKSILPVIHAGERKSLWLNIKNPLYREIIEAGRKGQKNFKVIRTGSLKETRYQTVQ
jgi:hypothetical protein